MGTTALLTLLAVLAVLAEDTGLLRPANLGAARYVILHPIKCFARVTGQAMSESDIANTGTEGTRRDRYLRLFFKLDLRTTGLANDLLKKSLEKQLVNSQH